MVLLHYHVVEQRDIIITISFPCHKWAVTTDKLIHPTLNTKPFLLGKLTITLLNLFHHYHQTSIKCIRRCTGHIVLIRKTMADGSVTGGSIVKTFVPSYRSLLTLTACDESLVISLVIFNHCIVSYLSHLEDPVVVVWEMSNTHHQPLAS